MWNDLALTKQEQRRWILAFAISIAVNEIFIGLLHRNGPTFDEHVEPTVVTLIERTPAPTPPPTPKPTPPPVVRAVPHATLAPHPQVAAPKAKAPKEKTRGGSVSRHANPTPDVFAELAHSGLGHERGVSGTGTGTGTGTGNGGGLNGTGTGTGGNGTGESDANAPCNAVYFRPIGLTEEDGTTYRETMTVTVTFPDGDFQDAVFPYKWVYPDGERTDPWSQSNLRLHGKETLKVVAQLPPPNADVSKYPQLIQYILLHTRPDGTTRLPPCPERR